MVTALLERNGLQWNSKTRNHYSNSFFTPNKRGVGGVYWTKGDDDRYRLTSVGEQLLLTGTIATAQQRKDALDFHAKQMNIKWEKLRIKI